LKAALKQKPNEKVLTFCDRCAFVQKTETDHVSQADRQTDYFKNAQQKAIIHKILEGLKPEIKERVIAQSRGATTVQHYREIARDVEVAIMKEKKKQATGEVATMQNAVEKKEEDKKQEEQPITLQSLHKELAAIQGLFRGRGRPRGRGYTGGRGQMGRGANTGNRRPGNCNYCHIPGHWERECHSKLRATQSGNFRGNNRGQTNANRGMLQQGFNQAYLQQNQQPLNQQGGANNLDIPNALTWNTDF